MPNAYQPGSPRPVRPPAPPLPIMLPFFCLPSLPLLPPVPLSVHVWPVESVPVCCGGVMWVCGGVCVRMRVRMRVRVRVRVCVCIYIYIYMSVCVCVHCAYADVCKLPRVAYAHDVCVYVHKCMRVNVHLCV